LDAKEEKGRQSVRAFAKRMHSSVYRPGPTRRAQPCYALTILCHRKSRTAAWMFGSASQHPVPPAHHCAPSGIAMRGSRRGGVPRAAVRG
jgi:hypothetical protein